MAGYYLVTVLLVLYFLEIIGGIRFQNLNFDLLQVKEQQDALFKYDYILEGDEVVDEIVFGYLKDKNDQNGIIVVIKKTAAPASYNPDADQRYKENVYPNVDLKSTAQYTLKQASQVLDSGKTFFCSIKLRNGKGLKQNTVLQIIFEPVIKTIPNSPRYVNEGNVLSLSCSASGTPAPDVNWYFGDQLVPSTSVKKDNNVLAKLRISPVNRTYTGNYTCEAKNIAGAMNATIAVVVQYGPFIDEKRSTRKIGTFIGNYEKIYLKCIADGVPPPTYIWNRGQNEIARGSTYILQQPQQEDFAEYICTASNNVGINKQWTVVVNEIRKPKVVNMTVFRWESRSAFINIISIDVGDSILKALILSYKDNSTGVVMQKVLDPAKTKFELKGLRPYTYYEINVTVTNEFFVSDGQGIIIQTKQDVPGLPSNIFANITSSTSINLTWGIPNEPNGILSNYEVYFKPPNGNATTILTDLQLYWFFDGLQPYTLYDIKVRAYTNVGPGDWSSLMNVRTDPEPPGPPRNVKIKIMDSHTVLIEWTKPILKSDIDIKKYHMQWKVISKEFKDAKPKVSDLYLTPDPVQGRKYKIDTIQPFSVYSFTVREGGGDRPVWGSFSQPTNFEMPEGEPSTIQNFVLLGRKYNQLFLRWSRPTFVNGVLRKFTIYFEDQTGYSDLRELSNQLNNKTFYYTLDGLQAEYEYKVFVRAHTQFHESLPSNWIQTKTYPIPANLIRDEDDPSNTAAILAGCVTVIVVVIIGVIVFIYMSRKKRMKHSTSINSISGFLHLATRESSPVHVVDAPVRAPSTVPSTYIPNEYARNAECTFTPLKPVPISKLKEYVLQHQINKDRGFIDEFRSIKPDGDFTYEVSAQPENKCKNRYANILAYDHSRVVLNTVENLDESDYINANYIDGYNKKAKFIATQGPVSAAFTDFWRMVWEQNCDTIVMVTNLIEKSRAKCQKYWPSENEKRQVYGKIAVEIIDEMELADYVVRRFRVCSLRNGGSSGMRKVTHYQFLSWPDHGVPQYSTPLLQFVKRIRGLTYETAGPIICHCSAGVGRTGTYIVLDAMMDQIEMEKLVDVFGYVTHIRSQRNLMVQTEPQYVFIYNALLESVLCGNTEVNTCDLPARIKHLNSLNPNSSRTYMQEEYERLELNMPSNGYHFESAMMDCNKSKNRFADKLPYEMSRVKLWPYPNIEGSDYINASFIDGYQQREAYILTQAPLENTIQDFWRMTWEYECLSIVMISSVKERDMHHCYPYWPESNEATLFGLLRVQIAAEEEKKGYIKREFRVTNSKNGETRIITHFMYFDWLIESAPDCAHVIDMIGCLQKTQQQTGNNSIIIHCSDGCGRSGSLAALMYCLERLKLEGVLDVYQTVRTMRTQRTAIVQSLEQYQFIYKAVRNFLDCFSNYANFK